MNVIAKQRLNTVVQIAAETHRIMLSLANTIISLYCIISSLRTDFLG